MWGGQGDILTTSKQLKVQYIGIFEEIDSLLTKNALLKRGPKNSGNA